MPAQACRKILDIGKRMPFALSFRDCTFNKLDLTTNACTLNAFFQTFRTFGCAFVALYTTSRAFFATVSRHSPDFGFELINAQPLLTKICKVGRAWKHGEHPAVECGGENNLRLNLGQGRAGLAFTGFLLPTKLQYNLPEVSIPMSESFASLKSKLRKIQDISTTTWI